MARVLIVDDEPQLLEIAVAFLEKVLDFWVETSQSAEDALQMIRANGYDAIVCDYQMPGMNGIDLLKSVRQQGNHIPFILFTGKGREDIVIEALNSGADFYLQKGGDPKAQFAELGSMLKHALQRRESEKAIHESFERFSQVAETAREWIWELNNEGVFTYASPAVEQILGYRPDELVGKKHYHDLIAPEVREQLSPIAIDAISRGETIHNMINRTNHKNGSVVILETSGLPLVGASGDLIGYRGVDADVTARVKSETERLRSESRYHSLYESMMDAYAKVDLEGRMVESNKTYRDMTGYSEEELSRLTYLDITPEKWHDMEIKIIKEQLMERGYTDVYEKEYRRKNGKVFPIELRSFLIRDDNGNPVGIWAIIRDITDRRLVEQERDSTIEFLKLANQSHNLIELIKQAAAFFQRQSGCDAVGVRLKQGEDYPYFESIGFPSHFLKKEATLCEYDHEMQPTRDCEGRTVLACMCGKVILGKVQSFEPYFTKSGSFWTNSTTELLASTNEAGSVDRARNQCNIEGYESVALIPLRVRNENLGLLQLNDRRKGMFTSKNMDLWERLTSYLAVAMARFQSEEALHVSELSYRSLFEGMLNGVAYCQMLYDDLGLPMDWIYLKVNRRFVELTGLMDVEGKRVSEVIPGIFEEDHNLFEVYGNAASTGHAEVFDTFVKSLDKWMRIAVYSPEKGYFIAVFDDITERTHQQEALVVANRKLNMLSDITRHDTLNNLTALQGYLLSVDKSNMQSAERVRWEKMLKLVKLIDSQIGFTREYKDMGASPPKWLNAQQACEEATALLDGAGILYEIKMQGLELRADPLLSRVFYNLIDNSKSHGKTVKRIRITYSHLDDEVIIVYEDDGIGIPADLKARIFEDHRREEGFGLLLAKSILDITEIKIGENGKPGIGARFEISVPRGSFRLAEQ